MRNLLFGVLLSGVLLSGCKQSAQEPFSLSNPLGMHSFSVDSKDFQDVESIEATPQAGFTLTCRCRKSLLPNYESLVAQLHREDGASAAGILVDARSKGRELILTLDFPPVEKIEKRCAIAIFDSGRQILELPVTVSTE